MKIGRPSKWKPEVNEKIVAWFERPLTVKREVSRIMQKGAVTAEETQANELPTLLGFAIYLGVTRSTLNEWASADHKEDYPGFSEAYARSKEYSEEFLAQNAMMGNYNPQFAMFMGKNMFGWRDKTEVDQTLNGGLIVETVNYADESTDAKTSEAN
jgi:hypothetical protein